MKVIDYLAEELKKTEPVIDYLAEELEREQEKQQRTGLKEQLGRQQVQDAKAATLPHPKDREIAVGTTIADCPPGGAVGQRRRFSDSGPRCDGTEEQGLDPDNT
jgi:hypothetical protein